MKDDIKIQSLDHVAILVKDMDVSIAWYEEVLGLKKYKLPVWGEFPIFMLTGKCGVALFPAEGDSIKAESNKVQIDHFAFNVDSENFIAAKKKYNELGLKHTIKDHHYFHSIYTEDPDGHTVELTTIMVNENDFYE